MKASKVFSMIFVLVLAAALAGCATGGGNLKIEQANFSSQLYSAKETATDVSELLVEPIDAIGIRELPGLVSGNVSFFEVCIPEDLLQKELFPWRIRWYAWAVTPDGTEYPGQIIFLPKGVVKSGRVFFHGGLILEGNHLALSGAKVVILSTRLKTAYGLDYSQQTAVLDQEKFKNDPAYRKSIAMSIGTETEKLPSANYLQPIVNGWNRYQFPRGHILSPLGTKEIKLVAGINPSYSFTQKMVAEGDFVLSTDFVGMGLGLLFDAYRASRAPSRGWDADSETTPEAKKVRGEYLEKMRERIRSASERRGSS